MNKPMSESDLEAYLDEALPGVEMVLIEEALRQDESLVRRLLAINARRDNGVHSLGEIWRRNRLTCPSREQLGNFLLGVLPDDFTAYITFHLEKVGCRYCCANADDLRNQQAEAADSARSRRSKYFQSSAGYLKRER